jgi:antitoxin ParD1/3/4
MKRRAMPSTQTFHVTLPDEMADMVREKVASGAYASESDVFNDGLRVLKQRDALETWLKTDVAASYDEYHADPSSAVPSDEIMGRVQARYLRAVEARAKADK